MSCSCPKPCHRRRTLANLTIPLWVSLVEDDDNNGFIGTFTPAGGEAPVDVSLPRDDDEQDFFVTRAKLNFKFGTY